MYCLIVVIQVYRTVQTLDQIKWNIGNTIYPYIWILHVQCSMVWYMYSLSFFFFFVFHSSSIFTILRYISIWIASYSLFPNIFCLATFHEHEECVRVSMWSNSLSSYDYIGECVVVCDSFSKKNTFFFLHGTASFKTATVVVILLKFFFSFFPNKSQTILMEKKHR